MKKNIIILIIISISYSSFSQNYFKLILGGEKTPTVGYNFIKTDDGNFIISGMKSHYTDIDTTYAAYLTKISSQGEIILEKDSILEDTSLLHREITKGSDGHFWVYTNKKLQENLEEIFSFIFSEYDKDFNRLKMFEMKIPDSLYFHYYGVRFNTTVRNYNNQLIWADNACVKGKWDYYGFIYKFNTDGDSLNFITEHYTKYHDVDIYDDKTFYVTKECSEFPYNTIDKINMDDLTIDSSYHTVNLTGHDLMDEPAYIEFISDTTYAFFGIDIEDQKQNVLIVDTAFNVLNSTAYGGDYQTFMAQNKGLAISNDKNIFTVINPPWLAENYVITKLDKDLNILWERFFPIEGGKWLHSIEATNDGGCAILGEIIKWDKFHIIFLKTDENGNISSTNDNNEKTLKELIIYPNPSTTNLNIRTAVQRIGGEFIMYDITGKQILQQKITQAITSINTSNLPSGTYIYKYIHKAKEIESGKWVKK